MTISGVVTRPRHAEIAAEARIGRRRRDAVVPETEVLFQPVAQLLQARVARVASVRQRAGVRRSNVGSSERCGRTAAGTTVGCCETARAIIIARDVRCRRPTSRVLPRLQADAAPRFCGQPRSARWSAARVPGGAGDGRRRRSEDGDDDSLPHRARPIRGSTSCCRPTRPTSDIDVTSDTGELGRDGDAILSRQRHDPHGPAAADGGRSRDRCRTAQRAAAAATWSTSTRQLRVRGQGGSFQRGGAAASSRAREFELLDRSVRGAAESARVTRRRPGHRTRRACATPPARPATTTGNSQAGEIAIDQKNADRHRPRRRARFPRRADLLHAVDHVSGRRPAQVRPAVPDRSAAAARAARWSPCPTT